MVKGLMTLLRVSIIANPGMTPMRKIVEPGMTDH